MTTRHRTRALVPLLALLLAACSSSSDDSAPAAPAPDTPVAYRQEMRAFVEAISAQAKAAHPGFAIVPQNGQGVISDTDDPAQADAAYLAAIDGLGREDLNYGYDADGQATAAADRDAIVPFLDALRSAGVAVLVTDYVGDTALLDDTTVQTRADLARAANAPAGYVSFSADRRDLDDVPPYPAPASPWNYTAGTDVTALASVRNFLYVLDPTGWGDRAAYLTELRATNHDLLIIDAFDGDGVALTSADVAALRVKDDGSARLVIAYMSIGEAESYRDYWQAAWSTAPPDWLAEENPDWPGNYKVRYWEAGWQAIILGEPEGYLARILAAGFDGVYLDIIDAYEYFEAQAP